MNSFIDPRSSDMPENAEHDNIVLQSKGGSTFFSRVIHLRTYSQFVSNPTEMRECNLD